MSTVEFGSLFDFIRNGMNVKQDKSGDGLPISRIETIWNSSIDPKRVGYADLEEDDCDGWLLSPGDILFSHINSVEHIGKCAVYEGVPSRLVHGMNLLCLRCNPESLLPAYAKHLIRSDGFRGRLSSYINKAVNQASVSIGNLKGIEVTIPSLTEQRRIAAILDKADALRTKRREALAQLDRLAQSIFVEMFGDPMSPNTPWKSVPVSSFVAGFESGKSVAAEDEDDSSAVYRVLKVSAVTSLEFKATESKAAPPDHVPQGSHFVRPGDLLFSRANTTELIGATAYVVDTPGHLLLPDKLWRFVWHDAPRVTPHFVNFLFRQPKFRAEIGRRASGSSGSMKNISQEKVMSIEAALPPLALQQEFSDRIEKVMLMKVAQAPAAEAMDSLFASLQDRAFRGEL